MAVRSSLTYLAINALGVAIFLFVASRFWIEPELADVPGANVGNAFGWVLLAAPIPILFLFGDLVWTMMKMRGAGLASRARYTALTLAMLAGWSAAYLFDNAHHGM